MLFVRKETPTVIVEESSAARTEATLLAEERGRASGTVAALGIMAIAVLVLLVGYFAWWAPVHAAQADQVVPVIHDTQIVEKPAPTSPTTTIINNPPITPAPSTQPPVVIHRDHIIEVPVPSTGGTSTSNNGTATTTDGSTTGGDTGTTGQ